MYYTLMKARKFVFQFAPAHFIMSYAYHSLSHTCICYYL